MQISFYVNRDGEDVGPFTREEIERKLKSRELAPHDYVFLEEKDDWVLLSEWLKPAEKTKTVVHQTKSPDSPESSKPLVTQKKFEPTQVVVSKSARAEVSKVESPRFESSKAELLKTESVRATHGEAQVSMRNEKAGTVSIQVEAKGLQSPTAIEINFTAGPVDHFVLEGPSEGRVGEPLKLTVRALDRFGNLSQFDETVRLTAQPGVEGLPQVHFRSGVATVEVKHTKVEPVEFSVSGIQGLNTRKSHRVQFKAGRAVRIVVETPKEAQVGQETFIQVKAVDAYGNLDVGFSEVVTVRLGGVMSGQTEVRLSQGVGAVKVGS